MLLPLMDTQGPTISWSLTGSLPSGMTFTRASAGTYFDAAGALQSATNNAPRLDHDPVTHEPLGLLMEDQRQNVFLNSDTPATQNISVTAQVYTLSFYGTGRIALSGTHTATVTGTGAYPSRKTYSFTPTAGTLTLTVSGDVQKTQLEAGSSASSYVPTTGTAVTRARDDLYTTSIPWFNPTQGTFVVDVMFDALTGSPIIFGTNTGSNIWNVSASDKKLSHWNNVESIKTTNVLDTIQSHSCALRYNGANRAIVLDGGDVVESATAPWPSTPTGIVFGRYNNTQYMYGHLRSFKYWNRALSKAELQKVTS